jgi:hypothetical protein
VYSLNASRGVVRVRGHASSYWHERSVNWAGRVGFGREIARSGHLGRGRWAAIDVTRFLGPAPVLSLSLETRSRRAIVIASRETGSGAPRLVVSSPDPFLPSLLADLGGGEPAGEPPCRSLRWGTCTRGPPRPRAPRPPPRQPGPT